MKKNIFKTLAVTVLSAVSLTAWAVDPYAGLVNTTTEITFDGKAWYLIEDNSTAANAGTVTLLTKECVGTSAYNSNGSFVEYSDNPTVKTAVDAYYTDNISAAAKEAVIDDGMFLLTTAQASTILNANRDVLKCSQAQWWLCSRVSSDRAVFVDGALGEVLSSIGYDVSSPIGVRPALQLDLSKVSFDTETKTFSLKQKAYADYDVTTDANKTKSGDDLTALQVKFNEKSWYIIEDNSTAVDAGTVTLLAADMKFGTSKFKSDESSNSYNSSDVKAYLESIVAGTAGEGKPNFSAVADAIKPVTLTTYEYRSETVAETTENAKLYLLSTEEAKKLSVDVLKMGKEEDMIYWWLRSPGDEDYFQQEVFAAMVYGEAGFVYDGGFSVLNDLLVRPALQLDLSKVSFDTETKTFGVAPTTSVATPTLSPADAAKSNIWYDLNGRHYQGKPTMQGVYINNHQKYVVK